MGNSYDPNGFLETILWLIAVVLVASIIAFPPFVAVGIGLVTASLYGQLIGILAGVVSFVVLLALSIRMNEYRKTI